ncbi:MAG TPA: hypothetical protein VE757_01665, partial [Gaiellaceae bacterium]|nr:hypothetical protein [Gaiellaceae bacterium]
MTNILQKLMFWRKDDGAEASEPRPTHRPNDPSVVEKPPPPETLKEHAGRGEGERNPLERSGDLLEEYGRSVEKGEPPDYDKL